MREIRRRSLGAFAAAVGVLLAVAAAPARADIVITEYMYQGADGEFIEFTNIGALAVDMTGWSFDDDSRLPGTVNLSLFGIVAAGESVILTEADASAFRTAWGLSATVKIIGGLTANLGRNDEINLFDASNTLVDRLTYGDQTFPGTIRTQTRSGNPTVAGALGTNQITLWTLATAGDGFGSYASTGGDIGSPGQFTPLAIPEPSPLLTGGAVALAGLVVGLRRRGRADSR